MSVGCATINKAAQPPLWADSSTINQVYPEDSYITGIAGAATEDMAAIIADGNLAAYFSREISSITQAKQIFSNNGINDNNIEREVTIKSQIALAGVEHTKGWYNKQERLWYVCAYQDRVKAWQLYESKVIQEKSKFYSFYNAAEVESDPFRKTTLYNEAKKEGVNYSEILNFAEILYKEGYLPYSKDRIVISSIDRKITEIGLNLRMQVIVSGDIGEKYKPALEKVLSDNGYLISDKNYSYTVTAEINSNKKRFTDSIVASPLIDIQINNQNETLLTLSQFVDRISGFTEAEELVDKKVNTAITKIIQKDFAEALKELAN